MSYNPKQLFSEYTKDRFVTNGQNGLILSCGHPMTGHTFYSECIGSCLECSKPLNEEEIEFLSYIPKKIQLLPIEEMRMYSIRPSITQEEEEENKECTISCPVCMEQYDSTDHRISMLQCCHPFCFQCSSSFDNKCFICRIEYKKYMNPYKLTKIETTRFEDCVESQFVGYKGHPIYFSGQVYDEPIVDVLNKQFKYGKVKFRKIVLWVFKNQEALIVELNPGSMNILYRWENISLEFISTSSDMLREASAHAITSRAVSSETYTFDTALSDYSDDLLNMELAMNSMLFSPVMDSTIHFVSPRTQEQVLEMATQFERLGEKDNWLVGLVISPLPMLLADNIIKISNHSPFVFRSVFKASVGNYYDYSRFFVKIVDGQIIDYICYNYVNKNGKCMNPDLTIQSMGIHSGDYTPFQTSSSIVHEFLHSTHSSQSIQDLQNFPLKTWNEVSSSYKCLGYTHAIDVGSAYPRNSILQHTSRCNPSLLIYTCDENGLPIGYNIHPQTHLLSSSVALGLISLDCEADTSNYITLGWNLNGYASDNLEYIQMTIDSFNTILLSKPTTLELLNNE